MSTPGPRRPLARLPRPALQPTRPPIVPPKSNSKAHAAPEAEGQSALWSLIRTRQRKVWAVAIGVGVVACTLLGAQLKTVKQEVDERKRLEEAAKGMISQENAFKSQDSIVDPVTTQSQQAKLPQIQQEPVQSFPSPVDVARQIALLEDRKTLLNRQKATMEAKVRMLQERMAKKAETEARRSGSGLER